MSNIFLKDKIYGVCVLPFQIAYIRYTTNTPHKNLVKLCRNVNYMWWGNQELELQKWEYFIKPKKNTILAIIMLFPNNNTPRYKENVTYFTAFSFGKGATIIY